MFLGLGAPPVAGHLAPGGGGGLPWPFRAGGKEDGGAGIGEMPARPPLASPGPSAAQGR
ncbi:MAG: hypothetical protein LBP92_04850 [Deltaproteobacteria bacterium]|nr:hypothetical protein [Deltaproteobacteria bacterium]